MIVPPGTYRLKAEMVVPPGVGRLQWSDNFWRTLLSPCSLSPSLLTPMLLFVLILPAVWSGPQCSILLALIFSTPILSPVVSLVGEPYTFAELKMPDA